MFRLHFSNHVEQLTERLLDDLAAPPASPFAAEQIIVPSAGMRRWLELRIADRFGVCANVDFSFPAHWIWRCIARTTGAPAEASPFSADVLAWRLFAWLDTGECLQFPRLRTYLGAADPLMRYELAARTARMLEQYVTYRQDWLRAWSAGRHAGMTFGSQHQKEDEAWQAAAWRSVSREIGAGEEHPAERMFRALAAAGSTAACRYGLPERVHVFALSALPPLYLDIFRRFADWTEVGFYLINPCREYWIDIHGEKQLARLAAKGRAAHAERGHALLSDWGGQCKDFIELVLDASDADFEDHFVAIPDDTLLRRLQGSILKLDELGAGSLGPDAFDDSIQFHVCHSLSREIEVLHDQLLARFNDDPTLQPADVLVVAPELERAAPLIDAVFGAALARRHVPHLITGRRPVGASPIANAFLDLLDLPNTRYEASRLYDLLLAPSLARSFGFDEEALEAIHRWMRESGIRWGADADHRAAVGAPDGDRHTFAAGMRSLLLGYTLPAGESAALFDVLPYPDIEGREAFKLGGLWRFYREAATLRTRLAGQRTVAQWKETLAAVLGTFFSPSLDEIDEVRALRGAIEDMATLATSAGYTDQPVPFDVIRAALTERIDARAPGGVPSACVTFTGMTPLRGLPYRIVCCIGLDHASFPAVESELEFDLIAHFPRKGDRQHGLDERNAFLDLILSARDCFYVSYTGRSARDNRPLPPSVVVADLLDYLVSAGTPPNAADEARMSIASRLVTEHPLQPFSARYFTGENARLFSFNRELCNAVRLSTLQVPAKESHETSLADEETDDHAFPEPSGQPFFVAPLKALPNEASLVSLDDLCRFVKQPAEYLLKRRLGLSLRVEEAALSDEESFGLDFESESRLGQSVVDLLERGAAREAVIDHAMRHPYAPPGSLGRIAATELAHQAERFVERRRRARGHTALPPLPVTLELEGSVLAGVLDGLNPSGMIRSRFGRGGDRDRIDGWVRHLALCVASPNDVAHRTQFIGGSLDFHFEAVSSAHVHLERILRLYGEGLQRPVHLFLRSGLKFLEREQVKDARTRWRMSPFSSGAESDDPFYRLAFREDVNGAIDEEFTRLSREILRPMREALIEGIHAAFA